MPQILVTARLNGKTYVSGTSISTAVSKALTINNRFLQEVAVELRQALDKLYNDLAIRHGNAWPTGTTSRTLSVRSGGGLRSIKESIKVDISGNEVTGSISAAKLSVHETGATITAKNVQYLTIPLTAAMDSRGLPLRARARDWENTFVARSKRGNLIIFQRQTGGKILPLYLLKHSVKIPPRLGMGEMFEKMLPYFQRKTIDALERTLQANG